MGEFLAYQFELIGSFMASYVGRGTLGGLVNLILLVGIVGCIGERRWSTLLGYLLAIAGSTAVFSLWAASAYDGPSFGELYLALLGAPFVAVGVLAVIGLLGAGTTSSAPQSSTANTTYDRYGNAVNLHRGPITYRDDYGNQYDLLGSRAEARPRQMRTTDGSYLWVSASGDGDYFDESGNRWVDHGNGIERY